MNGSKDLYDFVLSQWGIDAQVFMLIEEQAELNFMLSKLRRAKGFYGHTEQDDMQIAGEIADNLIMLEQMTRFFNIEEEVEIAMMYKLQRLTQRSGFKEKAKDILPKDAVIEGEDEE